MVGIATSGQIRTGTVASLIAGIASTANVEFGVMFKEGAYVDQNRNYLAEKAVAGAFSHLLFIDEDMAFPKDAITKLLAQDKDIISVYYNKREFPLTTVVKEIDENGNLRNGEYERPKEASKVWAVGMGLTLIRTGVFGKVPKPWFQYGVIKLAGDGPKDNFVGEDFYFCEKAHAAGFDVWVEPTIAMGHIGYYIF